MNDLQKLEAVGKKHAKLIKAEERLLEQRAKAERITMPFKEINSRSREEGWQEDAIIRLIELRDEFAKAAEEYADSLWVAHCVLEDIPDPQCHEVLFRRYVQEKTWKQIAKEMGCSQRNCMILHKIAINAMNQTN